MADPAAELTDAAVAVAHCAAEILELVAQDDEGNWCLTPDEYQQLQALVGAWQRAGDAALRSLAQVPEGYLIGPDAEVGRWVCAACECPDVEDIRWVSINTGEVSDGEPVMDANFCPACDDPEADIRWERLTRPCTACDGYGGRRGPRWAETCDTCKGEGRILVVAHG